MKVAVIGCSHSDTTYIRNNWVEQLANKYPNHMFHNYSVVGSGQLDIDCILKHFVKYNLEYDKVILQFSGNNRWIIPSVGKSKGFDDAFINIKLTDNLNCYRLDIPRSRSSRIYTRQELKGVAKGFWSDGRVRPPQDDWVEDQASYSVGFAHYYSDLLRSTFSIYPYDFIYWTFRPSHTNNIGQELCAHDWFEKYHPDSYVETYTDDTLHLNELGNTILLEQYLQIDEHLR